MRPEGPCCPRGQQQVHSSAFSQIPSQAGTHPTLAGLPDLLLPMPARQGGKEKHTIITRREKKRQDLPSLPTPPTPSPPRPGQTLPPPAPRPPPRPTAHLPGRPWSLPQEPYAPCVVGAVLASCGAVLLAAHRRRPALREDRRNSRISSTGGRTGDPSPPCTPRRGTGGHSWCGPLHRQYTWRQPCNEGR